MWGRKLNYVDGASYTPQGGTDLSEVISRM